MVCAYCRAAARVKNLIWVELCYFIPPARGNTYIIPHVYMGLQLNDDLDKHRTVYLVMPSMYWIMRAPAVADSRSGCGVEVDSI